MRRVDLDEVDVAREDGERMLGALRRLAANHEAVDTSHQALATMKINGGRSWAALFSTHPPIEQRIAALENFR